MAYGVQEREMWVSYLGKLCSSSEDAGKTDQAKSSILKVKAALGSTALPCSG